MPALIISKYHFFCRYARHVSVGDEVLVKQNYDMTPEKIINVSSFKMQGIQSHYLKQINSSCINNNIQITDFTIQIYTYLH